MEGDEGPARVTLAWPQEATGAGVTTRDPAGDRRQFRRGIRVGVLLCALGLGIWSAIDHWLLAARVTVRNGSSSTVHRVLLKGQGVWEWIGDLGSGQETTVHVHPRGVGEYELTFLRESGREEAHPFGYYSAGSLGTAGIEEVFEVKPEEVR